jgi:hypothetical protein
VYLQHTLLGLSTERLVEHIGHILEDLGVDILLLLGVQEVDGDGPVAEGEARNTTIGVGTEVSSMSVRESASMAVVRL